MTLTEEQRSLDQQCARQLLDLNIAVNDPESVHERADQLLLDLLTHLSCDSTVRVYQQIKRWYA